MRNAIIALGAALIVSLTAGPAVARADSGSFMTDDGPSCFYSGLGGSYTIDCSGYSRSAGRFVRYSCDYQIYGYGSASWTCRDGDGNRWSGSR